MSDEAWRREDVVRLPLQRQEQQDVSAEAWRGEDDVRLPLRQQGQQEEADEDWRREDYEGHLLQALARAELMQKTGRMMAHVQQCRYSCER